MPRVSLCVVVCLALAGCGGMRSRALDAERSTPSAEGNVRAVIPALEAYYADNRTYAGATLAALRSRYDAGIPDVRIVRADARTYCVESTVGGRTVSKRGPGADLTPGGC